MSLRYGVVFGGVLYAEVQRNTPQHGAYTRVVAVICCLS